MLIKKKKTTIYFLSYRKFFVTEKHSESRKGIKTQFVTFMFKGKLQIVVCNQINMAAAARNQNLT